MITHRSSINAKTIVKVVEGLNHPISNKVETQVSVKGTPPSSPNGVYIPFFNTYYPTYTYKKHRYNNLVFLFVAPWSDCQFFINSCVCWRSRLARASALSSWPSWSPSRTLTQRGIFSCCSASEELRRTFTQTSDITESTSLLCTTEIVLWTDPTSRRNRLQRFDLIINIVNVDCLPNINVFKKYFSISKK